MNNLKETAITEPEVNIRNPIKGTDPVIIDGKEYKAHYFKPGNTYTTNRTGFKDEKRIITKVNNAKDLKQMKLWCRTYGVTRVMMMMERMSDSDFFKAFVFIAPYCLPKIAAVENKSSDDTHAIDSYQKDKVHTITVKDMRTGMRIEIPDE